MVKLALNSPSKASGLDYNLMHKDDYGCEVRPRKGHNRATRTKTSNDCTFENGETPPQSPQLLPLAAHRTLESDAIVCLSGRLVTLLLVSRSQLVVVIWLAGSAASGVGVEDLGSLAVRDYRKTTPVADMRS